MYMIIIYKEPYVLLIKQKKKNHKNCMKSTDQQPTIDQAQWFDSNCSSSSVTINRGELEDTRTHLRQPTKKPKDGEHASAYTCITASRLCKIKIPSYFFSLPYYL